MSSSRVLSYLWYPLLVTGAIASFAALIGHEAHLAIALYVPIALVALAVVLLEFKFPERTDWRPRWRDVKQDAAFLAMVQVLLPRALSVVAALAISESTSTSFRTGIWPHEWPLAVQAILMVLCVDFTRYWLHRACHRFNFLWRLHEVHHSPETLYTLNVGRFHPFEKALHFALDTVPFLLLGVAPEVIAAYFLLYAVNGFFQHSNLRLQYGWLNYVVGSAQTHRWHHARDPRTAACNFGNTTIVWDLLFGTWYLPRGRVIDDIGIPNRAYPKDFFSQMWAPFQRVPARVNLRSRLTTMVIQLWLHARFRLHSVRLASIARDPMRMQRKVLADILRANRDTTFGRKYDFDSVKTHADFARRVPVHEFEALRNYVEANIERDEAALTREPTLCYVRTSGTTGKPKDVPITRSYLRALRRIQATAIAFQRRACEAAFDGSILAITSPAREGVFPSGKTWGAASGVVADATPRLIADKFVVPSAVFAIADSRVKYLLILRLALARPDITYMGTANASTLLTLMKLYREHAAALIEDLRAGGFFLESDVDRDVWGAVRERMQAQPERAAALAAFHARQRGARIADLWPNVRMVVTWCGASAGVAVSALRGELSAGTRVFELGYLASEFRGTISLGRNPGMGLPTLDTHFFEFVERDKWDRGEPEFLTLDRIRKGLDYYIVVTTSSGLYRYFINDLVRVSGFWRRTPLLKFMQKGKGVTNITGEKLYESQVLSAVNAAASTFGCTTRFVVMLADAQARAYKLYVEADAANKPDAYAFAHAVDAKLMDLNVEYRAKRESGRLGPLTAAWLVADTREAHKQFFVQRGQREGQFKAAALAYREQVGFDLEAHAERG